MFDNFCCLTRSEGLLILHRKMEFLNQHLFMPINCHLYIFKNEAVPSRPPLAFCGSVTGMEIIRHAHTVQEVVPSQGVSSQLGCSSAAAADVQNGPVCSTALPPEGDAIVFITCVLLC